MAVVAQINDREGRGTLRIGRLSVKPVWAMRRQMLSQRYTTRWDEVIGVRGGFCKSTSHSEVRNRNLWLLAVEWGPVLNTQVIEF